jgi:hypothetical protein
MLLGESFLQGGGSLEFFHCRISSALIGMKRKHVLCLSLAVAVLVAAIPRHRASKTSDFDPLPGEIVVVSQSTLAPKQEGRGGIHAP